MFFHERTRRTVRPSQLALLALAPALTLGALTPTSSAQIFGPPTNFDPGGLPRTFVLGDLNNDGALDIAVMTLPVGVFVQSRDASNTAPATNATSLRVLLADGAGGFTFLPTVHKFPLSTSIVAHGDLNNDGALDLVAVGNDQNNNAVLSTLLGDGAGGFATLLPVRLGFQAYFRTDVMTDMNGDGNLDLVAFNPLDTAITVLLGDGAGGFTPLPPVLTRPLQSLILIRTGDVNGDGVIDVAVLGIDIPTPGQAPNKKIVILQGDGSGGLTKLSTLSLLGSSTMDLAMGDLNGDGNTDIALAGPQHLFFGDGAGGFTAAPPNHELSGSSFLLIDDVNGDGALDLAAVTSSGQGIIVARILLGDGAGDFALSQNFVLVNMSFGSNAASPVPHMAMGDLNGDGVPDIVATNFTGNINNNSIIVLLNQTTTCTKPADLNGDGVVDSRDLARLLVRWNVHAFIAPEDINCDGLINSGDLSLLLANWG